MYDDTWVAPQTSSTQSLVVALASVLVLVNESKARAVQVETYCEFSIQKPLQTRYSEKRCMFRSSAVQHFTTALDIRIVWELLGRNGTEPCSEHRWLTENHARGHRQLWPRVSILDVRTSRELATHRRGHGAADHAPAASCTARCVLSGNTYLTSSQDMFSTVF